MSDRMNESVGYEFYNTVRMFPVTYLLIYLNDMLFYILSNSIMSEICPTINCSEENSNTFIGHVV